MNLIVALFGEEKNEHPHKIKFKKTKTISCIERERHTARSNRTWFVDGLRVTTLCWARGKVKEYMCPSPEALHRSENVFSVVFFTRQYCIL